VPSNFLQSLFDRASWLAGTPTTRRAGVQYASVRRGTETTPFLFFPLTATDLGGGRFAVPGGSLWIRSRVLAAGAPEGMYSGLRLSSGEVLLPGLGFLAPGQLHVPATVTCTVDLQFAGADQAPASAKISLPPAGAQITAPDITLTVIDVDVTLTRTNTAPAWDVLSRRINVPFDVQPDRLEVEFATSLATVRGTADVKGGSWLWPTLSGSLPDDEAESSGGLAIDVGQGLTAEWSGLDGGPVMLGEASIFVEPSGTAILAQRAERRASVHRLAVRDASTIELALDRPFLFGLLAHQAGFEILQFQATVSPSLERPVEASGSRLGYRGPGAVVAFMNGAFGLSVQITSQLNDPPKRFFGLALENALLSVSSIASFRAQLTLADLATAAAGTVDLTFGLCHVLPTLPDPYAANFSVRRFDAPRGILNVQVTWPAGAGSPTVTFTVPDNPLGVPDYLPIPPDRDEDGRLWSEFEHAIGGRPHRALKLLDVSTNASQIGVVAALRTPAFDALQLIARGSDVHIFAVPQVQWEPVRNIPNPKVPVAFPREVYSLDDGDQMQIGVHTVHMVPVEPRRASKLLLEAHNQDGEPAAAIFTLPFGMQAMAQIDLQRLRMDILPSLVRVETSFDDFEGALFFRLTAGRAELPTRPEGEPTFLPGFAMQHPNIVRGEAGPVAVPTSALDPMRVWFDNTFGPSASRPQVPISQIDLSGFGASAQSVWIDDVSSPPTVSQVRFNIHVGRTAREVVQFRTVVWPCQATFVRTITMERTSGGHVVRWDSGWLATTPGLFERPDSACKFHKASVAGLFNIREIEERQEFLTLNGGAEMQGVYFDADAAIADVVSGTNGQGFVPALRQKGYIQHVSLGQSGLLTPAQLTELLQRTGPIGGPIGCDINIGGSGQRMRLQGLHGRHGAAGSFFVMLSGSPTWTKRGSEWSVARIYRSGPREGETEPVDRHRGVPLVRPDGGNWQLADPGEDVLSYALLNASPTHRVLFPAPEIKPGAHAFTSATAPMVADPYAMVTAAGLFPRKASAISFPNANYSLDIASGGLKLDYPSFTVNRTRDLIKTGSWGMRNVYGADGATKIDVRIDPDAVVDLANRATWPIKMDDVSLVLDVPPLADLMRLVSEAPSLGSAPGQLPNPRIVLGPALDALRNIMSVLDQMKFPGPFKLSVNAAPIDAQTFRVAISLMLKLATKSGDRVDIGVGKLLGELKVSAELEAGLSSVRGRLMLEIGGDLQQGILPPLLYAGGMLRFQIGIDHLGKPDWRLDAGTVASIGGNLIPGLVEVEGTVHYAYMLRPDLSPGVRIGMQARAKVLSGLIGIKFGVDAGVTIKRPGPPEPIDLVRLMGDVNVHGSVTVAWVLEPDFSRTMRFEQDIQLRFVALAAIGGFLPAPL
jgi:hypothetical protein